MEYANVTGIRPALGLGMLVDTQLVELQPMLSRLPVQIHSVIIAWRLTMRACSGQTLDSRSERCSHGAIHEPAPCSGQARHSPG